MNSWYQNIYAMEMWICDGKFRC